MQEREMTNEERLKRIRNSQMGARKMFEALTAKKTKFEPDSRLWYPIIPNGENDSYAQIRILPSRHIFEGKDSPIGSIYVHAHHSFEMDNGKKFFANCPKHTEGIGEACPVCESLVWSDFDEGVKRTYRLHKVKRRYLMNVLIIKDGARPENNGRVVLLDAIEPIQKAIDRAYAGKGIEGVFDPCDIIDGRHMTINLRKKGNYSDYSISWSENPVPLVADGNLERLTPLIERIYDLSEIVKEPRFKVPTYEEISKILSGGMAHFSTAGSGDKRAGMNSHVPSPTVTDVSDVDDVLGTMSNVSENSTSPTTPKDTKSQMAMPENNQKPTQIDDDFLSSLDSAPAAGSSKKAPTSSSGMDDLLRDIPVGNSSGTEKKNDLMSNLDTLFT